jgi:hypothetical protein
MNATLLPMRRLAVLLATLAILLVFAVTPVAAGECDDDDEDCDTGGGVPNTALEVPGPDYSSLLTVIGGTTLLSAAGLRVATRKLGL